MKRSDFYFVLPPELIAQTPPAQRTDSRLLCLDRHSGALEDSLFISLPQRLQPGDLLIFNDTRVIPARIFGHKATGGKLEILIERLLSQREALAHLRTSKSPKPGAILYLDGGVSAIVVARQADLFHLRLEDDRPLPELLEHIGHIPLPPYIEREDTQTDRQRYQTVYAQKDGAVAAPTAGLHFDKRMLDTLREQGVNQGFVTLHVGAGTFQPVRCDDLTQHEMHAEWFNVPASVCQQIAQTKAAGGRVIAVGTTSVRALESAAASGTLEAGGGDTRLFITPGYEFRVVDALLTNFHLPESTLLMLVSAFAGSAAVRNAYAHAVHERYRFFSYGDAMWIA